MFNIRSIADFKDLDFNKGKLRLHHNVSFREQFYCCLFCVAFSKVKQSQNYLNCTFLF